MELYEFCNKLSNVVWHEAVCTHTHTQQLTVAENMGATGVWFPHPKATCVSIPTAAACTLIPMDLLITCPQLVPPSGLLPEALTAPVNEW